MCLAEFEVHLQGLQDWRLTNQYVAQFSELQEFSGYAEFLRLRSPGVCNAVEPQARKFAEVSREPLLLEATKVANVLLSFIRDSKVANVLLSFGSSRHLGPSPFVYLPLAKLAALLAE